MKYLAISLLLAGLFGCSSSPWASNSCESLRAKQTEAFEKWISAQDAAINGNGSLSEAVELGEQHEALLSEVEKACIR